MMGKLWIAAAMLLAGSACSATTAGTVDGSGTGGQRSYPVAGFDRVALAGHFDVRVTVGGASSVRAEGDEAELERLEIGVDNGRLRIGSRPGSWNSTGKVIVHVTTPNLQGVEVAGSGNMDVAPLRATQFRGGVAGSGNLVLQGLESDEARFEVAGSGNVRAAGRTRALRLEVAGSGTAAFADLQAETAQVEIAGSGGAQVRASGTASVATVGSGDVVVVGGARCTVSKVGSGNVRCG
jgi:hypothetical protein